MMTSKVLLSIFAEKCFPVISLLIKQNSNRSLIRHAFATLCYAKRTNRCIECPYIYTCFRNSIIF